MKRLATYLTTIIVLSMIQSKVSKYADLNVRDISMSPTRPMMYIRSMQVSDAERRELTRTAYEFAMDRNKGHAFSEDFSNTLIRVASEANLDPRFILSIIRVENDPMDHAIENWYGAIGLMQVVGRLHLGEYPHCGDDLTDLYTNLCYGVNILEYKMSRCDGDLQCALWNYNGCTVELRENGENCVGYPRKVQNFYTQLTEEQQ